MRPSIRSNIGTLTLGVMLIALLSPRATLSARSEAISQKERDFSIAYLEETRAKFVASVEGLSEAQWKFKAAPERWSVAETAEHITVSEATILGLVTDRILKSPPAKPAEGGSTDDAVIKAVTDRSTKQKAPEFLVPTGKWATREELVKDFLASRGKTINFVKETQAPLRSHSTPHPVLKSLDGYQWILLLAAHSARHTAQIDEVKADPNFPKK